MNKTATITLSVRPKLLKSASRVLQQAGLNTADAVTLFLQQVVLHGGLPFAAGVPNVRARQVQRQVDSRARRKRTRRRPLAEDPLAESLRLWRKHSKPYK